MPTKLPYIRPDKGNVNCPVCSRYNVPGCPTCHRCKSDCKCAPCPECQRSHVRSRCNRCGHCKRGGQCTCGNKPAAINVPELAMNAQVPKDIPEFQSSVAGAVVGVDTLNRPMSIEVELSNWNGKAELDTNAATGRASRHRDGSVHGENPTELILGPLMAHQFRPAMDNYATWVKRVRAAVNTTCGLHVHVGTQDLDGWSLRRLVQLWRIMEPAFYDLTTADRRDNKFCYAWPKTTWSAMDKLRLDGLVEPGDMKLAVGAGIYGLGTPPRWDTSTRRDLATQVAKWARTPHGSGSNPTVRARYYGLNLHSHFYRGTVEFRMHHGTADPQRIAAWAQWCGWFVELATRLGDSEVSQIRTPQDYVQRSWHRGYGELRLPPDLQQWYREAPKGPEVVGPPEWDAALPRVDPARVVLRPNDRPGRLAFDAAVNQGHIAYDRGNDQWVRQVIRPHVDQIGRALDELIAEQQEAQAAQAGN